MIKSQPPPIVISQIGFCCAYLIFLAQNISHYLAGCYIDEDEGLEDETEPVLESIKPVDAELSNITIMTQSLRLFFEV